jgi:hypothetical protein
MWALSDSVFQHGHYLLSIVRPAVVERLCPQRGRGAEGSPGGWAAPPSARRLRSGIFPQFVKRRDRQCASPFLRGVLFASGAVERQASVMLVLAKTLNFRDGSLIVLNCGAAIAVVDPQQARHGRAAGDVLR